MIQECKFNPLSDIMQPVPNAAADISECIRTGVIPATGTEGTYSDIENPSEIGSYVRDKVLAAYHMMQLNKSVANVKAEE